MITKEISAFWRGREAERTPEIRRALFERRGSCASERVAQPPESASIAGDPEGHARAEMVLGTFAETKVPRRAGAKPRIKSMNGKPGMEDLLGLSGTHLFR